MGGYDFICTMSQLLQSLRGAFDSRVGRNVVFWICMFLFLYSLNLSTQTYPGWVYLIYKIITTLMLLIMSAINNLVLIPRLLLRKKRAAYIISAFMLTMLVSIGYVFLFIDMQYRYPGIEIHQVSFVSSPVTKDWTWTTILEDTPVFAIGLGMWLAVYTMAWYMQDHARQRKLAKEALHKQTETELSLLRSQVNPHFLFNTLNNIYGLSLQKSDRTPESILKLSSIMRYLLYEADVELMSFEKEKEVMQAYIDMELLRLPAEGNYQFTIEADKSYLVPPLLWLPVLENVFKHGTRMITDDYYLRYAFIIKDNIVSITSENKFKEQQQGSGGLGLSNLQKRLEILFPGQYAIKSHKEGDKYSIEVKLTLPHAV